MKTFVSQLRATFMPGGRVFYGWWIVLASANAQLLSSLLWMQTFGAYLVLMQEEFGWSKTLFSLAFALARFESGILGPLQGWLVDRFGPRIILTIGMVLFGAGFLLFSKVNSLLGFYLTFGLIALGSSLGGFATLMVSLVNWFSRHRSKAVAISQAGYAIGGLGVPAFVVALEHFGWRDTAFASGLFVLAVGIPLAQFVRHRPEEIGERVDGAPADHPQAGSAVAAPSFTAREAMRTSAFWLISVGHAIALLSVAGLLVHLIPHLTEGHGFILQRAAFVVSVLTVFQLIGQVVGGYLGDRFNKRLICSACMVGHAIGLLLLTWGSGSVAVFAFAAIHGLSWGARGPQMVALRADYFGPAAFGTILGFSSMIVMLGTAAGPLLAGYLADTRGNYELAFSLIAAASLVGAGCFWFARPPAAAPAAVSS
ncbi:MAG: MFS transporter [Pseudomonadota bacterium]